MGHRRWLVAGADKKPRTPATLALADVTDPLTWDTYAAAVAAVERAAAGGDRLYLGYVLGDGVVGVDVDHCIGPDGDLTPEAAAIVRLIGGCAEKSMSGTGAHILCCGELPPGGRRRGNVELYDGARFFVVTGDALPGSAPELPERTAELAMLHRMIFPPTPEPPRVPPRPSELPQDDRTILERAMRAPWFGAVYAGDWQGHYPSQNEADLAVCNRLAGCGADHEHVDRLVRASGLYRKKWDRDDYRQRTIDRAFDGRMVPPATVSTAVTPTAPTAATTPCAELAAEVARLRAEVATLTARAEAAERRAALLSEVQSRTVRILQNKSLGSRRTTAAVLAYEFANWEAAGNEGPRTIPLARIAERAGVSVDVAGDHVAFLADAGILYKRTETIPGGVDTETGELVPLHRELKLAPTTDALGYCDAAATWTSATPRNWGGKRDACPVCGSERRKTVCANCEHVFYQDAEPTRQDAPLATADAPTPPNRQDDGSLYVTHRGVGGELPNRHLAGLATGGATTPLAAVETRILANTIAVREGRAPLETDAPNHPPLWVNADAEDADDVGAALAPRCVDCEAPLPPDRRYRCHHCQPPPRPHADRGAVAWATS